MYFFSILDQLADGSTTTRLQPHHQCKSIHFIFLFLISEPMVMMVGRFMCQKVLESNLYAKGYSKYHNCITLYFVCCVKPIFHCNAKYLASGVGILVRILRWGYQHVGIMETTQTLKFASPPTQNLKFAFYPTQNQNASQWNIGCVGSQRKNLASGMYMSFFVCRFHSRWVDNANHISSGIWA